MTEKEYITTKELAKRWGIREDTLRHHRMNGTGPEYMRIGEGSKAPVRYKLSHIIEYENRKTETR